MTTEEYKAKMHSVAVKLSIYADTKFGSVDKKNIKKLLQKLDKLYKDFVFNK